MLAGVMARFETWLCYRMSLRELLALSDSDLADAGFNRADLRRRVRALHYGDPLQQPTAAIGDILTPDDPVKREILARALLLHLG